MADPFSTLTALTAAIQRGDCTLTEALRAQIAAWPAEAPAVVARHVRTMNDVPAELRQATGPLAGCALAHKDIFDLPGRAPGCGDHPQPIEPPTQAATALARLTAAGAVNVAALAMSQLACGSTADHPWSPALLNPLDPAAAVGGSSGGSAVAVAAGYCLASLGTDTFGSVRIPAATCGLVGFKPTAGHIPNQGVAALAPSLDTVGVLAHTVEDAARVYAVAAGRPVIPTPDSATAWRVSCLLDDDSLDTTVGDALAHWLQTLPNYIDRRRAGAPSPQLHHYAQAVLHAEAYATRHARLRADPDSLAPSTLSVLVPGAVLPAHWHAHALAQRDACYQAFVDTCLADADVLLLPALPNPVPDADVVRRGSPRFNARELLALHTWMPWANYLGMPALVMPIGYDHQGRPMAVQMMARRGQDATLLALARALPRPLPAGTPVCAPSPATPV